MSTREQRINAAQQTLSAFEAGYYMSDGRKVEVSGLHRNSMNQITLHTPESIDSIEINNVANDHEPVYKLIPLPVVSALSELKVRDSIGILNFASAKNPGGGFLNGAQAQEESLAMCGNLYLTQIKKPEYYHANRVCNSMLYTDYMIYSKDVVFIREDTNEFWRKPMIASVLTAPAVNMGQYLLKENANISHAETVMKDRMRKILKVFASQGDKTLILGAYGCGVFRNDPKTIAGFFVDLLKGEDLESHFQELIFAVYDSSKSKNVYNAFEQVLRPFIS